MMIKRKNQSSGSVRTFGSPRAAMLPAVILLTLIAALWIGSFVQLAQTEVRLSYGTFQFNSSLNLAEGAVERGMLALNTARSYEQGGGTWNWAGWTQAGGAMRMNEATVDLGRGTKGVMRATVFDRHTENPRIVAEGVVLLPNQPDVSRRLEVIVELRRPWENAFTFDESITLNGQNITFDSYDSKLGPYHPDTNRNANATLACRSLDGEDDIDVGNAKVFGYIAVGEGFPTFNSNGNVSDLDAPAGTVDESRISEDFAAYFELHDQPAGGDYIPEIDRDWTLGTRGGPMEVYTVGSIVFNNHTLTIAGPVEIYVNGDIRIGGGSGSIVVEKDLGNDPEKDAGAMIYAGGNITIGGDGAVNHTADPRNLIINGTHPMGQTFKLHGGSEWIASIHAPNADIELGGGGSTGGFFGAMVGRNLTVGGNYDLHYDETLADLVAPFSTYRPTLWRELFAAETN